ncbi:ATP-binding protein [Saccharopolyspora shandongensis]|uniref:ATP-binding protein n=1 Tax=Saccharopolyspora shandongensis TaxID=418495 RepID=UPI0033C83782
MTFGTELRRIRQAAGLSLADLAARIHFSKSYLSKIETGMAPPTEALAVLCDAEFGTGGELAGLLSGSSPRARGRHAAAAPSPSGLPAVTPHFVGRGDELGEIRDVLLRDVPGSPVVCAVHGMAGVGKTALVVRCAHRLKSRFPGGCLFLDLRGHTTGTVPVSPGEALDRCLRLLGVPGAEIPADVDDRAAVFRDRLRGRSVLIVLDNAHSTEQVRQLIPAEPKCRVLVTSRRRLVSLDDAHHVKVTNLPASAAATLFRSLAPDNSSERGTERVVDRIVEHCGRLPLAVRIAAARLRTHAGWRLADLEGRLADRYVRLSELDDGERCVAAAFQLSYQDVPSAQQRLFGLLALHPGADWEVFGAAALAGVDLRVAERLLASLHDAHLIDLQPTGRYRFHDLIRAFARTVALADVPEAEQQDALRRLVDLHVHVADQADRLLAPSRYRPELGLPDVPPAVPELDDGTAVDWMRAEWANDVALCDLAAKRGFHERCWQLAFALRSFFFLDKLWDPWVVSNERALNSAASSGDHWAEAIAANNLGVALIDRGELDQAAERYRRALGLFETIGDQHGVHTTLNNLAWVDHYRGEHRTALAGMQIALAFYRSTNATRNAGITMRGTALVEIELGDFSAACGHLDAALLIFDELGLDLDAAMTLNGRGWAHFCAGNHTEAAAAYRAAAERSDRCGSTFESARAESGLGNVAAATGRPDDARKHWNRADLLHSNLPRTVVAEARTRLELQQGGA